MARLYVSSVNLAQEAYRPTIRFTIKSQGIQHIIKPYFLLINSIFIIISLLYIPSILEAYGDSGTTVSPTFSFSNVTCTNGIGNVLLIGQFNNNGTFYRIIFLKILVHDTNGHDLATGYGNISDIKPHETKMFNAVTRFSGNFSSCEIQVDNVIPK